MFATRYYTPEGFAMTAGVGMPVDLALLKSALKSVPQLQRRSHAEATDDRRFAEAVYRAAVADGIMEGATTKTRSAPAVQADRVSRKRRHSASISYSVVARHDDEDGLRQADARRVGRRESGTTQAGARNGFGEPETGHRKPDIATSGSGGDRTPLIRPAERLELGAYSSDTGK